MWHCGGASMPRRQCFTVPGLCVLGCVQSKWLTPGARGNGCADFIISWILDHRGQLFVWREAFWVKRTIHAVTSENGISLQWKESINNTSNLNIQKMRGAAFRITGHWVVKRQFFFYWPRFYCKLAIGMETVPLIAHTHVFTEGRTGSESDLMRKANCIWSGTPYVTGSGQWVQTPQSTKAPQLQPEFPGARMLTVLKSESHFLSRTEKRLIKEFAS